MSLRKRWNYENTVSVVVCYVSTGKTEQSSSMSFVLFQFKVSSFNQYFVSSDEVTFISKTSISVNFAFCFILQLYQILAMLV